MGLFIVLSRVVKLQHTKKEHIKMNNRIIIRGLIIALVVSLVVAGAYACEADSHTDNGSTNNVEGLYVSGSGDVAHVHGFASEISCYVPDSPPAALNN